MGIHYQYINDCKREFFCIDPTGQDIKSYAVGRNIGSRLLHLLLLDDPNGQSAFEHHPFRGSWIGDRVYVGGDDYTADFDRISAEYEDVGKQLIELLAMNAPDDLHQYGGHEWLECLGSGNSAFQLSSDARRSVLRHLRGVKKQFPSADLDRLIKFFRPITDVPDDTQNTGQQRDARPRRNL